MKVAIAFVGLLSLALAVPAPPAPGQPRGSCELQGHLRDILNLVNQDDVAAVLYSYLSDPDVQQVWRFLFSQEFRDLYMTIGGQPEVVSLGQWMESQCVNVRGVANAIRDYLEMPPVPWRGANKNGLINFWEDLKAVIPLAAIRDLGVEKYASSAVFADFIDTLRGEQALALFRQLQENATYQHAVAQLAANGINIDLIREVLGALLGWA